MLPRAALFILPDAQSLKQWAQQLRYASHQYIYIYIYICIVLENNSALGARCAQFNRRVHIFRHVSPMCALFFHPIIILCTRGVPGKSPGCTVSKCLNEGQGGWELGGERATLLHIW